mmetsp:Transcript_66665/g.173442  ORF Transcript_66665/g.173442 Transcript_66665/m.173442 type:complete len:227 (-) Transcript_66665:431-1111(-)
MYTLAVGRPRVVRGGTRPGQLAGEPQRLRLLGARPADGDASQEAVRDNGLRVLLHGTLRLLRQQAYPAGASRRRVVGLANGCLAEPTHARDDGGALVPPRSALLPRAAQAPQRADRRVQHVQDAQPVLQDEEQGHVNEKPVDVGPELLQGGPYRLGAPRACGHVLGALWRELGEEAAHVGTEGDVQEADDEEIKEYGEEPVREQLGDAMVADQERVRMALPLRDLL